jgi:hypothetical protein
MPPSSELRLASLGWRFLLFFSFIDQSQIMILSGRQLRGFHQYVLDMFVALFELPPSTNALQRSFPGRAPVANPIPDRCLLEVE